MPRGKQLELQDGQVSLELFPDGKVHIAVGFDYDECGWACLKPAEVAQLRDFLNQQLGHRPRHKAPDGEANGSA